MLSAIPGGTTAELYLTSDGNQKVDIFADATNSYVAIRGSNPVLFVSTDTSVPEATAIADIYSVTKGMLPPRMTTTQRDAIVDPAEGLQIYNVTTHVDNFFNGSSWIAISAASLAGSDTQIQFNNSGSFGASADLTWNATYLQVGSTATLQLFDNALQINASDGDGGSSIFLQSTDTLTTYGQILGATTGVKIEALVGALTLTTSNSTKAWVLGSNGTLLLPSLDSTADTALAPAEGAIWYNSSTHAWRGYNGTAKGTFTFTPDA